MALKLGKLAPKPHPKTLLLAKYLTVTLPAPPAITDYEDKVSVPWEMFGNDQFGDCTCAGPAHEVMLRTANSGIVFTPEDDDVISMYEEICPGFDPTTDANDNGAAITDALAYMVSTGLTGHKIAAWAQIDYTNQTEVQQGIFIFGAVNIGVQLPQSAVDQFNAGQDWTVETNDGGIAGGHCICFVGYDADWVYLVTWGKVVRASWAWLAAYCDEAYCELASDWIAAAGDAVNNLNMAALQADLQAIQS